MRASAWAVLRKASSRCHPEVCRFVAGRRFAPRLGFHTSLSHRHDDDSAHTSPPQVIEAPYNGSITEEAPYLVDNGADSGPEKPPRPRDKSNYGSAARRAGRNVKRVKELPPVQIPPWFLDRNVILQSSGDYAPDSEVSKSISEPDHSDEVAATDASNSVDRGPVSEHSGEYPQSAPLDTEGGLKTAPYNLNTKNWREIHTVARAGLQIPSWHRADTTAAQKPHFVLFCPKDGASDFLDIVVRFMATENGTDFLRLSPQDIAEIGGDYLDEPSEFRANTISSLGYDAPLLTAPRNAPPPEDSADEEDFEEAEEEESEQSGLKPIPFRPAGGVTFGGAIHIGTFDRLQDVFKNLLPASDSSQVPKPIVMRTSQQQPKDMTPELKMGLLIETLLNTPEIKRLASSAAKEAGVGSSASGTAAESFDGSKPAQEETLEPPISSDSDRGSNRLIVLIHDYPQINSTANGSKFLDKLHEVVDARRKEGQPLLVIGTASSKDLMPSLSKSAVKDLQDHRNFGPMRTIVTPVNEGASDPPLDRGHKLKLKQTNIRHIRDMLRRIAPDYSRVAQLVADWELDVDSKIGFLSGLDESIWTLERVQRVATTALGMLDGSEDMMSKHLETALELIESSDNAKVDWVRNEKEHRKKQLSALPGTEAEDNSKERIRKLRKTCNDHEKKLLNGVVHPEDIRTTFADVQAPPSTIDALKTLTSLSLVRPDAFKYGVLATDKIPGLLLYGPPGTGKTLLARAVAKESGATVLEVSGSDVNDMYVGEGEKNVKAIFSLAKKLTPCIVFIDEADAILGARSGGSNRTSHRELINQFLREWDGMTEMSAFIMVATNRPFDLDEASLRRLPRRLLVDLPVEKDREAILKIHLKDELLDPEVSLSQLASETPFYSGSDLKNVAVAAALACVREEFETATAHSKDSTNGAQYQYAEKRTLHPRHFTKAMEEISASISEDMGSLSAIRKFDEKYGDRRGRRKKGVYGFKTVTDSEKQGSDATRVRNQT